MRDDLAVAGRAQLAGLGCDELVRTGASGHVEHGVAGHCLCAFVLGTDGIRGRIFLRTFGRAFVTSIAKRIAANWWDRSFALGAFGFIANYGNSHYPFNGNAAFVRVSLTDL